MQFSQVRSISAMVRRPIIWGVIFAIIGAVGWVFSVVLAVITLGATKVIANIFGYLFILSLPVAGIWELIIWIKDRKNKNGTNIQSKK